MKKRLHDFRFVPPHYFYACLVLLPALYFIFPQFAYIKFPYNLSGIIIFLLGFWLLAASWYKFKDHNTPEKFEKSTCCVDTGPYKISRNPMYLAGVLCLAGLALIFGNILCLAVPVLFGVLMDVIFIGYEEEKMEKELGKEFLDYKKKTRRWI